MSGILRTPPQSRQSWPTSKRTVIRDRPTETTTIQVSYRADFFLPGWIKIPGRNARIGARNLNQSENKSGKKLLSSSFLAFKSAYLLVLYKFSGKCDFLVFFPTFFSFFLFPFSFSIKMASKKFFHSDHKLIETPWLADFEKDFLQPESNKSAL